MSWVFCLALGTYELNRAERQTWNNNNSIHADNALQASIVSHAYPHPRARYSFHFTDVRTEARKG